MPRQYSYGKRPYNNNNNIFKPNNTKPWNKPFNAAPIKPNDLLKRVGLKGGGGNPASVNLS